jgi:hypothetical protein
VIFLLKYHHNPHVPKRRSIEKNREKVLKKEKEKKEKEKLPESLQIKGSQYSERRKTLQLQKSFLL